MRRIIRIALSIFVVITALFVLFAGLGVLVFVVTGGSYLPRIVAIYAEACLAWILLASLATLAFAFLDEL